MRRNEQWVQRESWVEELSGVCTMGASSEGFDSQESIIYQWWPAVQCSVAQCSGLSDDSPLRGRPRVFSCADSFGLRFNWVKQTSKLDIS